MAGKNLMNNSFLQTDIKTYPMKKKNLWLIYMLFLSVVFISCENDKNDPKPVTNEVVEAFTTETGLGAVYFVDTTLLNTVISWQGQGDYPGVDDWTTAKIPGNFDLYGGLPGQSEYYTISQTITDTDTIVVDYWESLQVKAHPEFGYRAMVGVFDIKNDSIVVAISKTLANPQYGAGGAWQIYVGNFDEVLLVLDTIYLKQ
jgi:hypothetical protein